MRQLNTLSRRGDNVVYWPIGPTNQTTGAALDQVALNAASPTGSAVIRLYNERKECRIAELVTRTRSAVAESGTVLEVPVISPFPFEVGDSVRILFDQGSDVQYTISTVTPGSDFNELTLNTGIFKAIVAGHPVRLVKKSASSVQYPVTVADVTPDQSDEIEYETDDLSLAKKSSTFVRFSTATEDGDTAENQASYCIITSTTAGATVSVGRRVRIQLGGPITQQEYGTVSAGSDAWGFAGTVPDTLVLPDHGLVGIEGEFACGAGLKYIEKWTVKVVE